jgi:hypothetical protein
MKPVVSLRKNLEYEPSVTSLVISCLRWIGTQGLKISFGSFFTTNLAFVGGLEKPAPVDGLVLQPCSSTKTDEQSFPIFPLDLQ